MIRTHTVTRHRRYLTPRAEEELAAYLLILGGGLIVLLLGVLSA
jgi:hypothetical protein